MSNAHNINLRVYSRTREDIVLLWSQSGLTADQAQHVAVHLDGKPLKAKCKTMSPREIKGMECESILCYIPHVENTLDPDKEYRLEVILGGKSGSPILAHITICKWNTIPGYDKDHKPYRVHLMGWDAQSDAWVRLPLVKLEDGGFAVPVVVVDKRTA